MQLNQEENLTSMNYLQRHLNDAAFALELFNAVLLLPNL